MTNTPSLRISVVLTCFNRRERTLSCLRSLFQAVDAYAVCPLDVSVFLTDDGCTDGTAEAVKAAFSEHDICITRSEGNLYWARGMCLSWKKALEKRPQTDFFLLVNDDTELLSGCFEELFRTYDYSLKKTGNEGLCSGLIVSPTHQECVTYGGKRWRSKWLGINELVEPQGEPLPCAETNANLLLVPRSVVECIGIFHDGYQHGCADFDYSMKAARRGIPSFVTGLPCGLCERDHPDDRAKQQRLMDMTLAQRKAYFKHPLTSRHDHLLFTRRNIPLRYPIVLVGRFMNLYLPKLYNRLFGFRN